MSNFSFKVYVNSILSHGGIAVMRDATLIRDVKKRIMIVPDYDSLVSILNANSAAKLLNLVLFANTTMNTTMTTYNAMLQFMTEYRAKKLSDVNDILIFKVIEQSFVMASKNQEQLSIYDPDNLSILSTFTSIGYVFDENVYGNKGEMNNLENYYLQKANVGNVAGGQQVIVGQNPKVVVNNKNPTSVIRINGMGNVVTAGLSDFTQGQFKTMGTGEMQTVAGVALRAKITENIGNYMQSQGGTKGLIALSRAAQGTDAGFLGLAPNGGDPSTLLKNFQIDPIILQMSSGDAMVNKYIGALTRLTQRETMSKSNPNFAYDAKSSRYTIAAAQFNTYINNGTVDIVNQYKGHYRMARTESGCVRGDFLVLDRSQTTVTAKGEADTLSFKNVTKDEDDITKERFELDVPLAPQPKIRRRKGGRKKKKGKTSTKAKTGGKRKRRKDGTFAKK